MSGSIGIFDSGIGGLTLLQAIETLLPHEDILYFADTAHFPYGEKDALEILRLASQVTGFLFTQNVKLLLIACHTISTCLQNLKKAFPFPILGMIEPSIELLTKTKGNRIALFATNATIHSQVYQKAIQKKLPKATLFPISCPDLIEKIEYLVPNTQPLIKSCVSPILDQNIDTLLLASTHLPHFKRAIEEELDPKTTVLNPALAVAQSVKELLYMLHKTNESEYSPHHTFYISGDTLFFQNFLETHPPKAKYSIRTPA